MPRQTIQIYFKKTAKMCFASIHYENMIKMGIIHFDLIFRQEKSMSIEILNGTEWSSTKEVWKYVKFKKMRIKYFFLTMVLLLCSNMNKLSV